MIRVFYLVTLFLVLSNFASMAFSLDRGAREVEQWRQMVEEALADPSRERRDADDAASIVNIQDYYRDVFDAMNGEVSYQSGGSGPDRQHPIKGRYLVLLKDYINDQHLDDTIDILQGIQAKNEHLVARHIEPFRHVGKGFSATLSTDVANILANHPSMYVMEEDIVLKRYGDSSNNHIPRDYARSAHRVPWNLDRIDQRLNNLDGSYTPEGDGHDIDVYVLDTGIRYTHEEFGGRAKYSGYDAIDELTGQTARGSDCNGHGTHCAATIGGISYGVAKKTNLYSARVLDCSGTGSVAGIVNSMEYIVKNRPNKERTAVFSLSVGIEKSMIFNTAINNIADNKIVVVAASGNQASDSCDYSPGSAKHSISVAATDRNDRSVRFSNIGACVDTFAPGEGIMSAIHTCDTCSGIKSGTSMACPHVTGSIAAVLSLDRTLSPQDAKQQLLDQATSNVVDMSNMVRALSVETPNKLLYVGADAARLIKNGRGV